MNVGRALRHRNYRLFFVGQGTSLVGTWITRVATSWLVYRLTGSAWLLGIVGFAGQIPTFVIAPFAGVAVDRWNRHRVLVWTQIFSMLQSGALAYFALRGTITVWHVIVLVAIQGLINAFDTPARQAFVVEMVDKREDLPNAIALNSTLVNLARLIGPSIAGILIAAFGEGYCFAIDAVSYAAVIASLLMMNVVLKPRRVPRHALVELREGFRYAASHVPIRSALMLLAFVSLVGAPYIVLMPIFAKEVLHGGAHTLGVLTGATGVGAIAGALWLASRRDSSNLERVITLAGTTFGLGLVAFSRSGTLALSLAVLVAVGAGMMITMAAVNTRIQTLVEEDKRGRVMSFFTMAFFGMAPFGALAAGALAAKIGAPTTVTWGGIATLLAVVLFSIVRRE
ncbi:MAG TPA: MFS transporter [Polyangiaceae bacterium]